MKSRIIEIDSYYTLKATGETVRVDKAVGGKYEVWTRDAQEPELVTARQLGAQLTGCVQDGKTVLRLLA